MSGLAVVTGAGSGLGAAIASRAAKAGYRVAAWDIERDAVEQVADQIGPDCTATVVDVGDEASVETAARALPETPTLVVNSAGIVRFGPLLDISLSDWDLALNVNLTGTFLVCRTLARLMAHRGGGAIVNLASINGVAIAPNAGSYTSGKAGIIRLTEQMAIEWAPLGIRANVVAPGLIDAGMSGPVYADPEVRRLREQAVPTGRLGTGDDVAEAVLFLGSAQADYITAQTLTVDGGVTKTSLARLPRPKAVDSVGLETSDAVVKE